MAVTVEIMGQRFTIEHYRWTGEDEQMVELLNVMLDPDGPAGWDPFPDYTAAEAAVERLGGEIVDYDEPEPLPEGTII